MRAHPGTGNRARESGFGILGLVILIAAVLVAAMGIGALYVRDLDQQRALQTRRQLEAAFGSLFGGPTFSGANLWRDFGYSPTVPAPPPGNYSLTLLVRREAIGESDPAHASVVQFDGSNLPAWNGPYYQGSTDPLGRPTDGWGRPLQLRYISTTTPPGWQVFSLGANGADDTGNLSPPRGDDLVFPVPPYVIPPPSPPGSVCPNPVINFLRTSGFNPEEMLTITLTWGSGNQTTTVQVNGGHPEGNPPPTFTSIPKGVPITLTIWSSRRGWLYPPASPLTFLLGSSCTASPNPITF